MKKLLFLSIIALVFSACEVSPKPINYGSETCAYCKMTIVDKQHASQLVNTNGKAYNFDAIECMIHYFEENKDTKFELYLVNNFEKPGTLINAKTATYLISPQISSPMGANLSGFALEKAAKKAQKQYDGEVYSWEKIRKKVKE